MKRIRIKSDGTEYSTRVEDADTGELIENVVSISITLFPDRAYASVNFENPELDVEVTAEEMEPFKEEPRSVRIPNANDRD